MCGLPCFVLRFPLGVFVNWSESDVSRLLLSVTSSLATLQASAQFKAVKDEESRLGSC